jgi:plastocyanin
MNSTTHRTNTTRRNLLWIAFAMTLALVGIIAYAATTVRAALDTGEPVTGVTDVIVRDHEFEPKAIQVPVGTTVTWRWEGQHAHDVAGDGFASDVQTRGTFTHTFTEAGEFDYRCTLHFLMRGQVVVTET